MNFDYATCTTNFLLECKFLDYTCLMHNFKTICARWFSVMLTPVAKQDNPDHNITIYHLDTWCQGNIKPIRANPKLQILLLSSSHSQASFECREHKYNHSNFILIPEKYSFSESKFKLIKIFTYYKQFKVNTVRLRLSQSWLLQAFLGLQSYS